MLDNLHNKLLTEIILHEIKLLRASNTIARNVLEAVNRSNEELRIFIERRIKVPSGGGYGYAGELEDLNRLIEELKKIRGDAWEDAIKVWKKDLKRVGKYEGEYFQKLLAEVIPVDIAVKESGLGWEDLVVLLVGGREINRALRKTASDDINRIESGVRYGIFQGLSGGEIGRDIFGSMSGRLRMTDAQVRTITVTANAAIATKQAEGVMSANRDIMKEVLYVAVLDGATTQICRSLNGKVYRVGKGPMPPVHYNCRSKRVPIIDESVVKKGRLKGDVEALLKRGYAEQSNVKSLTGKKVAASFTEYREAALRNALKVQPVPTRFYDWLVQQNRHMQREVLGRRTYEKFRKEIPKDVRLKIKKNAYIDLDLLREL